MTVEELKKLLQDIPDEVEVVISHPMQYIGDNVISEKPRLIFQYPEVIIRVD